ncbi:MAG: hypothetical protein M3449_07965 [Acidobacteriota bacterium]|nr:hypothetical protein [Blastocatellia bacterium]MDQ3220484.1 hypothetical protein [Acidobacteriota bacterium]MDQ3490984.1 hypothetical protein [Acidobacteriota bacterium]
MAINISNAKNRDAVVAAEGLAPKRDVRYVDKHGRPVTNRRLLKSDVTHDLPELLKKRKKLESVANALIKGDPEIDIEEFGMFLTDTSRVYVSKKGIVHLVEEFEVIKNPDGTVRERRPRKKEPQNMNSEIPLRWTGKFIKKEEAVNRFVFTNKKQLVHVNGLTFDFLFDMAKILDKKDSLLLIRGGENGSDPVVMNRGGKPYNAFLEGRVKGDSYCLILHLSNMELKKPAEIEKNEA